MHATFPEGDQSVQDRFGRRRIPPGGMNFPRMNGGMSLSKLRSSVFCRLGFPAANRFYEMIWNNSLRKVCWLL